MSERFRYKRKFIKKIILENKDNWRVGIAAERIEQRKWVEVKRGICSGNQIANVKYFGEQLWCSSCQNILSLNYIEEEKR